MKDLKIQENEVYQRQKLLGQGAFGKAYLVKEKATGALCVVKQMDMSSMSAAEQQEALKEAKILEALDHPNIVKFKDVYPSSNKKLNIVMEYADGGDISKRIAQQKKTGKHFNEATVLDWFTQMCLAMKHVHDRKIIHRDIKGQNIFLTKNNIIKLGDFGIAKILNKTMEKARTVVGTPYYLSPEIIESKPYSFKSDIWSLGVLLYQMCALQPPFNANSLQFLALKIVKGSYQPLQGNFSKQVKTLMAQMLNTDPGKRPSVSDILRLPFVLSRINNFLSQTQNKIEFSHTVLHNFKVNLKAITPSHQPAQTPVQSQAHQLESQRAKLKEEQARMQKLREDARRQEQKAREELLRKQKQQQKKQLQQQRRIADQKKRVAEYNRMMDEKKKQMEALEREQRRQQEKRLMEQRRERQQKKNLEKKQQIQQLQQKKAYLEFARNEWLRNQQIRRNAQKRAMMDQGGYQSEPQLNQQKQPQLQNKKSQQSQMKQPPQNPNPKANFHYKDDSNNMPLDKVFPKAKVQQPQRPSSVNRNRQVQLSDQQLMNAYANPNFAKKKDQQPPSKQRQQEQPKKVERPASVKPSKQIVQEQVKQDRQTDLKKKIEEGRMKMRQDKQKRLGSTGDFIGNLETEATIPDTTEKTIRGNKWQRPQVPMPEKPKPVQVPVSQVKPQSLGKAENTYKGNKWDSPPVKARTEEVDQVLRQNQQIQKFLAEEISQQQKRSLQMQRMIIELQKIVDDTNEKVEALPQIKVNLNEQMRIDDEKQPEKASQFHKATMYSEQDVNLEYFSDYNKLESLRMTLEDVFGTENFIKVYRIIEKQFDADDMGALDIDKIKKKVDFIDQDTLEQHFTHLLTVVVMENKVNEQCS